MCAFTSSWLALGWDGLSFKAQNSHEHQDTMLWNMPPGQQSHTVFHCDHFWIPSHLQDGSYKSLLQQQACPGTGCTGSLLRHLHLCSICR